MAKLTPFDDTVSRSRIAREEFITMFCWWYPATYKAMVPLSDKAAELLAAKEKIEQVMDSDRRAIEAERSSPWDRCPPLHTDHVDWEGVPPLKRVELAIKLPNQLPVLLRVKTGKAIDPADGEEKSYILFKEVERAAYRAGLGDYYALIQEYEDRLDAWDAARKGGREADIARLHAEAHAILRRQHEWRRDWEIRTAGSDADTVRKLHELQDQREELRSATDADGKFTDRAMHERVIKIEGEISKLERKLARG